MKGWLKRIRKDLKSDNVVNTYVEKHRFIEPALYNKLKQKKKCMFCQKDFQNKKKEIHHIIAVRDGGSNLENNLMSVHKECHKLLNFEQERVRGNRNGKQNE